MTGARLRWRLLTTLAVMLVALVVVLGPQGQDLVRVVLGLTAIALVDTALYIRGTYRSHRADIQALCAEIRQLKAGTAAPEGLQPCTPDSPCPYCLRKADGEGLVSCPSCLGAPIFTRSLYPEHRAQWHPNHPAQPEEPTP